MPVSDVEQLHTGPRPTGYGPGSGTWGNAGCGRGCTGWSLRRFYCTGRRSSPVRLCDSSSSPGRFGTASTAGVPDGSRRTGRAEHGPPPMSAAVPALNGWCRAPICGVPILETPAGSEECPDPRPAPGEGSAWWCRWRYVPAGAGYCGGRRRPQADPWHKCHRLAPAAHVHPECVLPRTMGVAVQRSLKYTNAARSALPIDFASASSIACTHMVGLRIATRISLTTKEVATAINPAYTAKSSFDFVSR